MAVVATGFFDGVHLGHRKVIETLLDCACRRGEQSLVLTFWPHPRTVLQNDARELRLLTSLDEKRSMLLDLGVDDVIALPFTREFAAMTAGQYLSSVAKGGYDASTIVLGYDNRLGSDLLDPGHIMPVAVGMGLDVVRCQSAGDISSTKIRKALSAGDVDSAREMLGYPYHMRGVVVSGNRLGRTIGFPTANIRLYDPLKLIPLTGAYLTEVELQGRTYYGMTNIDVAEKIETHIFNFSEDVYGLDIDLHFLSKIRGEMRFQSLQDLKKQLETDRDCCKNLIFGVWK